MALFKICRGNESNLPDALTDGYAYFCTDTGNFYIDWADAEANISRKHINAEYATKLRFKDENEEWVEIDPKDLHDMLGFKQVQADWEQNDPAASSYIVNRPFGLMPDLFSGTTTSSPVDGKTSLYQLNKGIGISELEDEKSYDVIWDGISYPCVCRHVTLHSSTGTDVGATVLGNANLLRERFAVGITVEVTQDAYPSDAPFCFSMLYNLSSKGGTHTVVLRDSGDAALKKLDVKYLPDSVATQDFVIEQIENIDIDQVQVDWNENDPSAKGYILNRPFGALPNLFEATLNITEDNMIVDGVYKADNTVNITRECVIGDTYNVFWRGAKYVCEFQQHTAHGPTGGSVGIDHLGNISLFAAQYPDWTIDGESNGLPFFIWGSTVLVNYPDHSTLVVSLDDATNFTKLDAKYLPDEAATKDFVMEQVASLDTEQINADWNEVDSTKASYILNRPFGLIQDILEQESYEFSHANNGSTAYRCGTASQTSAVITNPIHAQLQVGEIYIVIWDNVSYECVLANVPMTGPNSLVGTCPILGNPTLLNRYDSRWNYEGEDNNCPFVLSLIFDIAETKGTHTVAIRKKENFVKLDAKYLPDEAATKEYVQEALTDVDFEQVQADWTETDSSKPSYIHRKPLLSQAGRYGSFNYLTERIVGDVITPLPETTYYFSLQQSNNGSRDYYYATGNASSDLQQILSGQTYRVMWDGVEYRCVGQPISSIGNGGLDLPGFCFLGNISIWDGMEIDESTGEPFVVFYNPFENTRPLIGESFIQTYSDATEHTISITPVNDVIKLDKKYLPDDLATEKFVEDKIANIKVSGGGTVEQQVDLIPAQEVDGFHSAAEYGNLTVSERGWASLNATPFDLKIGDQCIVVWQGVEYKCTVFDASSIQSGVLAIGNGSNFGLTSNDEPFAMAWTANGITLFALDGSMGIPRTIRVYQTKVSSAGGVSSWNDLTDKPFYEEEVVVFDGEFHGTKLDSDGDGVEDTWEETWVAPYNNEDPLVAGKTYTFYWDGVAYTSECYSVMGLNIIGVNIMSYEDMDIYPVAIVCDTLGLIAGIPTWGAMLVSPPDMSHSGVIPCKICAKETKKIDDKYQHQPDWDETDVNRASFVKNKPFGILSKAGVLYESDVSYEAYDFGFMLMDFASEDVIIGGNYKVSVNGVDYTGVCEGAGSLEDGAITYTHLVRLNADGQATLGLVCNPTLVEVGVTIPATLAPENLLGDTRWENGEVCHIVISAMDEIVATVPHKYLDFIESHEDIVIPKMDVEFISQGGESGTIISTTEDEILRVAKRNGEYINVEFDGVVYKSKIVADAGEVGFGAIGLLSGVGSTSEPFAIMSELPLDSSDTTCQWIMVDIDGTLNGLETPYTKSIKVWFDGQATVKNEYLDFMTNDAKEIIPETNITLVCDEGDTTYLGSFESDTQEYLNCLSVKHGESYLVNWNGVEYTCIAQDLTNMYADQFGDRTTVNRLIGLGNLNYAGEGDMFGLVGTGEPFVIKILDIVGGITLQGVSIGEFSGTSGETVSRTLSVTKNDGYKIKNEYLGLMEPVAADETIQITVVPESLDRMPKVEFAEVGMTFYNISSKMVPVASIFSSELQLSMGGHTFVFHPSKSDVLAQGADYIFLESWDETDSQPCVFGIAYSTGNFTATAQGMTVTLSVPKVGIYVAVDAASVPESGIVARLTYNNPNASTKIKSKYLPEIHAEPAELPYFNLIEMGLPNIPIDGSQISIECDTSAIREAVNSSTVKVTVSVAGVTMTGVGGFIYTHEHDNYTYSQVAVVGGVPAVVSVYVTATHIAGQITPLGGGATVTMTDVSQEGA